MRDAYEEATERGLRSTATAALVFRQRVTAALEAAEIPEAETYWDRDKDEIRVTRSGYRYTGAAGQGGKVIEVAVLARTGVSGPVGQGERDAIVQQAHTALTAEGFEVRINEYGNLKIINR